MVFIAQDYKLPTYLFIDQHPSDKVIPGLIVKIVSEELSNLKQWGKLLLLQSAMMSTTACLCLETNLRGADTDMTVQEIVSDFKLITSAVENVLRNKQWLSFIDPKYPESMTDTVLNSYHGEL